MSAAVQCDGCKKFQVTEGYERHPMTGRVNLPDTWMRVMIAPAGREIAGFEWHVCSLTCSVAVTARAAERGELP